jgi:hypothetical protein
MKRSRGIEGAQLARCRRGVTMLRNAGAGLILLVPLATLSGVAVAEKDQAVQSISGSSQRSISGSSQRSISGSSQRSISGSSQRSISGSSQRSISGSSQRSISGSSQRSISGSSQRAVPSVVIFGPVTAVSSDSISVLGTEFAYEGAVLSDALGKVAYIVGINEEGVGLRVGNLQVFDDYAVPGASVILLEGTVEQLNADVGLISVAGISVDVTGLAEMQNFELNARVALAGTQPLPGGVLIAQSAVELGKSALVAAEGVSTSDLVLGD